MKQKQNVVVQWCLVILAGMFSLGSLLLFWKQDVIIAQGSVENPQVEGFDNKVEYLYTLTFVRENYNSNLQTRSIRWVSPTTVSGTLLVTGSVIVGENNEGSANSSAIFWGKKNKNSAAGATLGGGSKNTITAANATILGGFSGSVSSPNGFIGGGSGNAVVSGWPNGVVLGGENNRGKGDVILGMKNNDTTASNGNNLIVGTNTSIGTISNTFVRNDPSTAFSPTASNTFYVNTQGGMGVNTNAPVVKFDSRGAVKFGTLSPNQDICSSNPWIIGTISGEGVSCICTCSTCGYLVSLTDNDDEKCMEVCNSSSYSKYTYSGGAHQWIGSTQPDAECNKQPECNKQASGGFPYCFDIQF